MCFLHGGMNMKQLNKSRYLESLTVELCFDDLPEDDTVKPVLSESFCANSDLFNTVRFSPRARDLSEAEFMRQASFYKARCF